MASLAVIQRLRGTFKRSLFEQLEQSFLLLVIFAAAGFFGYLVFGPEEVPDARMLLLIGAIVLVLLSLAGYTAFEFANEYTFDGTTVSCHGWRGKRRWVILIDEISDVHVRCGRGGTFWACSTLTGARVIHVHQSLAKASDAIEPAQQLAGSDSQR